MFSLLSPLARSTTNGTELHSSSQVAMQSIALRAGEESNEVAERAATYDELFPYLMLAMVTAV